MSDEKENKHPLDTFLDLAQIPDEYLDQNAVLDARAYMNESVAVVEGLPYDEAKWKEVADEAERIAVTLNRLSEDGLGGFIFWEVRDAIQIAIKAVKEIHESQGIEP